MIFLSVGLPSLFAEWCDRVTCALVEAAGLGSFSVTSANALEEIVLASMDSRALNLVVSIRHPNDDLRAALRQTGRRFILALDDPRAAFRNLVTGHGFEWKAATRAAAGSCASLIGYGEMPGALVLRADREGRDPRAAATAIAQWLGIEISPVEIEVVVQGLTDPGASSAQAEFDAWWSGIPVQDRTLVDGALNGYIEYFSGGRMGVLFWERGLFFVGDDPKAAADHVLDVSGPIRYLLFGPYIAVPPGLWSATVVLAVARGAASYSYSVEICAGRSFVLLGRGTIEPGREGLCETTIDFAISEATEQPVEFRVANLQPVLAGRLALAHVTLSPRVKTRAEIPVELTEALGL
jgi:hypothetical protein